MPGSVGVQTTDKHGPASRARFSSHSMPFISTMSLNIIISARYTGHDYQSIAERSGTSLRDGAGIFSGACSLLFLFGCQQKRQVTTPKHRTHNWFQSARLRPGDTEHQIPWNTSAEQVGFPCHKNIAETSNRSFREETLSRGRRTCFRRLLHRSWPPTRA